MPFQDTCACFAGVPTQLPRTASISWHAIHLQHATCVTRASASSVSLRIPSVHGLCATFGLWAAQLKGPVHAYVSFVCLCFICLYMCAGGCASVCRCMVCMCLFVVGCGRGCGWPRITDDCHNAVGFPYLCGTRQA